MNDTNTTVRSINTKLLAAMMEFACKDITRFHLTGLGICDEGYLTVTDGHCLVRLKTNMPIRSALCRRWWPREAVDEMLAVAKARKLENVALDESKLNDYSQDYPPASQVVPKVRGIEALKCVGFNPQYFARIAKLHKACGGKSTHGAKLVSMRGEPEPILFELVCDDGTLEIVIMPMRM